MESTDFCMYNALMLKYITSRSFECMNHVSCNTIPLPYSWSDWGSTWYNWGCLNHLLIVICFLLSRLCALMRSASRISSTSVKNSTEVCSRNCLSFWDQYCKAFLPPIHADADQCDQIGQFLKVLGDMVSMKSSPNARWILVKRWKESIFILN